MRLRRTDIPPSALLVRVELIPKAARRCGQPEDQVVAAAQVDEPLASAEEYSARPMRQALEASTDRPAALMHFIKELSADEARALPQRPGKRGVRPNQWRLSMAEFPGGLHVDATSIRRVIGFAGRRLAV